MKKSKKKDKRRASENQIKEIDEWQKNLYNPGYYAGSGRIPLPIKRFFRMPIVLLIAGAAFSLPEIFNLISEWNAYHKLDALNIVNSIPMIVLGSILIICGIIRLIGQKK